MPTFVDGEAALSVFNKLNAVLGAAELILDPAALEADTTFTYTAGQARTVSVGTRIVSVVGGHCYQVVASGASVFDLQTAGGVRVLLLPDDTGDYNFDGMNPTKNNTGDNLGKLQKLLDKTVINAVGERIGPTIRFAYGRYAFSGTINLKSICRLIGVYTGFGNNRATDFIFPAATAGIVVNRFNTIGPLDNSTDLYGADGSHIIGIRCIGGRGTEFNATQSGIWLRARALVRECATVSFAGHGVFCGAGNDGNPYVGNCNLFRVEHIYSEFNRGDGIRIQGTDANGGTALYVNAKSNDGWGIYEASFLNTFHAGHHTISNNNGSYYSINNSVLVGAYSEDGGGATASWAGAMLGCMVNSHDTDTIGQQLKTDAANGPLAWANVLSGFRGTAPGVTPTNTTDIATEPNNIMSSRHEILGISTPIRWMWEDAATGTFMRYASSSDRLINFNGGAEGGIYGRTGAIGANVNIPRLFVGLNAAARMLNFASAAPTTGEWARGDIVFNNAPSAGGKIGWVCTAGGTPGTWKPWGAIDP